MEKIFAKPPGAEYQERRKRELRALEEQIGRLPKGEWVLELGCGHGHFLCAYAETMREEKLAAIRSDSSAGPGSATLVGVDKNPERIGRAKRKSERAGLHGVFWLNAKIEDVLEILEKEGGRKLREVFVLFPDPWPKLKQQKHRFVNQKLLESLWRLAGEGCVFYFRSDNTDYAEAVRGLLKGNKLWKLDEKIQWPEGMPATVFEGYHPEFESVTARRKA